MIYLCTNINNFINKELFLIAAKPINYDINYKTTNVVKDAFRIR